MILAPALLALALTASAAPAPIHAGPSPLPDGDLAVFSAREWEPVRLTLGLPPALNANFADEWMQVSSRGGRLEVFRVERERARRRRNWEWSATFGPSRTDYFPGTVDIRSSKVNVTLKNVAPLERESMDYWNPTYGQNPFQAIDEPTNGLYVRATDPDRGLAFVLCYFHPKFSMVGKERNSANAQGVIDGQAVNGAIDLNNYFHSYRLTKGFFRLGLGAEKFWRMYSGRMGTVSYGVGVSPQVYFGYAMVELMSEEQDSAPEGKIRPIGLGVGVTQFVKYEFPNSRFSLTATQGLDAARLKYKFQDGTATHQLAYNTFNVGLGYRIAPKKRREPPIPGL